MAYHEAQPEVSTVEETNEQLIKTTEEEKLTGSSELKPESDKELNSLLEKYNSVKDGIILQKIDEALNAVAYYYFNKKDYDNALIYYLKQYDTRCNMYGKEAQVGPIADVMGDIARMLNFNHKYEESLPWHEKVINIEKHLSREVWETGKHYNNYGTALYGIGKKHEALQQYETSLVIKDKVLPDKDHIDKAVTLGNIGLVYRDCAVYPKALDYYTQALAMSRRLHAQDGNNARVRSEIVFCLRDLGYVNERLGNTAESKRCYAEVEDMEKS